MTHAIVAQQPGGPEVLDFTEIDRPVPGPGQLLIKVAAAGVNFIDTYQRGGMYKVPFPFTPGSEAAGTVEEVGEGVEDFAVGSRVATAEGSKCYAGYTAPGCGQGASRCPTASTTSQRRRCPCRA